MTRGVLLAVAMLAAIGCDDDEVTYSYFKVAVTLDEATIDLDLRDEINSCGVDVFETTSNELVSAADLRCIRRAVMPTLGYFEYSTDRKKGGFRFVVYAKDRSDRVLARGETQALGILPGKTVNANVTLNSVTLPLDAGTVLQPDGGRTDGGDGGPSPDGGAEPDLPLEASAPDATLPGDGGAPEAAGDG